MDSKILVKTYKHLLPAHFSYPIFFGAKLLKNTPNLQSDMDLQRETPAFHMWKFLSF